MAFKTLFLSIIFLLTTTASAQLTEGSYNWQCTGYTHAGQTWEMFTEFYIQEDMFDDLALEDPYTIVTDNTSILSFYVYDKNDVILDDGIITGKLKLFTTDDQTTYEFYSVDKNANKTDWAVIAPAAGDLNINDYFAFDTSLGWGEFKKGNCNLEGPFED